MFKFTHTKTKILKIILLLIIFILFTTMLANSYYKDESIENIVNATEIDDQSDHTLVNTSNNGEIKYSSFIKDKQNEIVKEYEKDFLLNDYTNDLNNEKIISDSTYQLQDKVIALNTKDSFTFNIEVPKKGLYAIYFDYYITKINNTNTEVDLKINDQIQYYEMKQLFFGVEWQTNELINGKFATDRYGNEILPTSSLNEKWYYNQPLLDGSLLNNDVMLVELLDGLNTLTLNIKVGSVLIGKIKVKSYEEKISYKTYLDNYKNQPIIDTFYDISASTIKYKSSLSSRLYSSQDPTAIRYNTKDKLLNAVNHDSWNKGHQAITWEINVKEAGLYPLGFKYEQYGYVDLPVQRDIAINGEIPYQELVGYQFYYQKKWQNTILTSNGEPLYVYLNEGINTITMTVNLSIYQPIIDQIDQIMDEMSQMALDIKYLTNGKSDEYRDWEIVDYIPNLADELLRWANELDQLVDYINTYSNNKKGSSSFATLEIASKKLRKLAKEPNQIANNMSSFTDGSSSISQLLGSMILTLNSNPLGLERIFIGGNENDYPKPRANFFIRLWEGLKRLVLSFFEKEYSIDNTSEEELTIWVNRSRQYIEIMQQLADQAGLNVTFSIMPNETKLILANASNRLPDVAMGVSNWIPYDLALRGITTDLRGFDGYEEVVSNLSKGSLIPYAFEDGMYGLPETQDFNVLYYRSDIYDMLNIDVPSTWDDLLNQLPILQRLGYNFYSPLSSYRGLKPFIATLPFFYQNGGSLYAEDGMSSTLSSENNIEALKFMTNLFTIYNIPEETLSFYNSFRYGTLPIGIANAGTYTQLQIAAPEIQGNWSIAPHLGVLQDDGTVNRYACAGSQGITMFESSKHKKEAWKFIKWWLSTETQNNFISTLYSIYGLEYLWFTSNQNSFKTLPIPQEHIEVIQTQWEWAVEASRVPAAYMIERSISDAYSKVIFNGINPRIALDDAVIECNREIERKMTEFSYMKNGEKVKDYIVPTLYNIDNWLTGKR